ncbi:MAG: Uncharacterised protein [Cryomorphaceae bacterium]|nr:MAG: Uncharacterised protein [Cryomorphaceae bacterium]
MNQPKPNDILSLEQRNQFLRAHIAVLEGNIRRLCDDRDSLQQQVNALTKEVNTLRGLILSGSAVGERGDACMSIEGGNL